MTNSRDYRENVICLKWVRFKEADAIVKMVNEDGCLVEGIARGIRKPKSSLSSKLEPFNCIEVYLAKGRSLDVVKDSRIIQSNESVRSDPGKFACASCLGELFCKTLQKDIDVPKIFELTKAYISSIRNSDEAVNLSLTAAALLKASSYLGFMPSFNTCIACGTTVESFDNVSFSHSGGGVVCNDCYGTVSGVKMESALIANANAFLHMTFSEIASCGADARVGASVLQFANTWIKKQAGINLKSLPLAIQMNSC